MSVPTRSLVITDEARADITSIMLYTFNAWGDQQRDIYDAHLDSALQDLLLFPHIGKAVGPARPGLRALPVEQHVIYYRVDERTITVTRVLHGKMNAPAHLGELPR